jgi:hypothetical protein
MVRHGGKGGGRGKMPALSPTAWANHNLALTLK